MATKLVELRPVTDRYHAQVMHNELEELKVKYDENKREFEKLVAANKMLTTIMVLTTSATVLALAALFVSTFF